MTDRPIIFSGPMVRALLDGRKTMTRRLAWEKRRHGWMRQGGATTKIVQSIWQAVRPGDRLWVRENWKPNSIYSVLMPSEMPLGVKVFHQADNSYAPSNTPWVPSIHMPRWASRLTLTVTAAKVERLQDISEVDAASEGVARDTEPCDHTRASCEEIGCLGPTFRSSFCDLWTSLHGGDAWRANPEVVALTFIVSKHNLDRAAA